MAFQVFLTLVNASALREMAYDGNSACLIGSLLLGIVSLYTGLFGAGAKATVMISAAAGTFSLALAVIPAIKLSASESAQHRELISTPPRANVHTISRPNPTPTASVKLIGYVKMLLSSEEIVCRARELRGRRAWLFIEFLSKVLSLSHDDVDRTATAGLLNELIDSNIATPSRSRSNTVRAVRRTASTPYAAEIRAFRSARHLNLAVFRDDEGGPPGEAEPMPRAGVGVGHNASPLEIITGVAAGVAYLHSLDVPVVHGDIRAANIRIDPELHTSILELPHERWMHHASTTYHVTHDDIARHLAPEQLHTPSAWSESISTSTDIYSLAMTLLELMTGTTPFTDVVSTEDVISAVQRGIRPVVPTESVEHMFRLACHERRMPDSRDSATENTEIISTTSTGRNKTSVSLRDAMTSFSGLLAMMWAQLPEQRPSAQQVESRFEELVQLEESVLA